MQSQGQRPDGKAVWLFQQSPPMSLKELNNNAFVDIHCVILCTGSSRYTAGQVDFKKEYSNKFGKISAERRKSMYIYMYIYIYIVHQLCQNWGPFCISAEKEKTMHSTAGR